MTRDNAYIFASSNLRAKEGSASAKERLDSFINAPTVEALCQNAATAFGVKSYKSADELFDLAMAEAVRDVREAVPDFAPIAPLLFKYDCTNAKLLVKCSIMGIDPTDMLLSCGSASKENVLLSYNKGIWDFLPDNMKKAASEATELYKKTGEARIIDITLDKAAFADMSAVAEKDDAPLIKKIISARADSANILTALRIKNSNTDGDFAVSLLERSLVPGGKISADAFIANKEIASLDDICKKANESYIFDALKRISKSSFTFAEIEKIFDEVILSMLVSVKFAAYGIDVAVRYLLMREAEVLNCRIIAAGLTGGIASDNIRERVRVSYV